MVRVPRGIFPLTGETGGLMKLKERVAIVTGASKGIGQGIAERYAQEGATVVLASRSEDLLKEIGKKINDSGGRALALKLDVRDPDSVEGVVRRTVEEFGRLDILVNNAAATQIKAVDTLSDADIDWIIDTNLKGYVKCAREAVKIMKAKYTRGSLLFISSKNGLQGAENKSLYCATKGGELTLARSLAMELGKFGIRVNSICPDAVLEGSALWEDDNYRLGTAERYNISEEEIPEYYRQRCALRTNIEPVDVANAALFLLSRNAAKITGAILSVDGGVAFVR